MANWQNIDPEIIKKALKPAELKQYITLRQLIADGKILNSYQQKKYDEYEKKIEEYIASLSKPDELKNNPFIVSTSKAAEFFGKTHVAMHYWKDFPGYPKHAHVSHGLIDLKILYDWVVDYFYGDALTATAMAQEKLKYQKARAEREELLTQELKGKLVSAEKIKEELTFVFSVLRMRIQAWVKSLPPKLKNKEEKEIMKIMKDEVWEVLEELSKGITSVAKKER